VIRGDSDIYQPVPEDSKFWGNLDDESSAIPKGWGSGQLEDWQVGTAEGCESRGNSTIHRR
jgi:hypothetical protein